MVKNILHLCLPQADNLGDHLAHLAVEQLIKNAAPEQEFLFHKIDLLEQRQNLAYLDDELDHINQNYDAIVIGAGGLLSPGLINHVFLNPACWQQVNKPIFILGVGVIGNYTNPNHNLSINSETQKHLIAAINRADLISVRDMPTRLVCEKILSLSQKKNDHLFFTGCPTLVDCKAKTPLPKKWDWGINIPLLHGNTKDHQGPLLVTAEMIMRNVPNTVWICHSAQEQEHANKFKKDTKLDFDVIRPTTFSEVGELYAQINQALVTKAHAGYFCLANNVPFGMISYDMKCDALLQMITDFPIDFSVHIHHLNELDFSKRIQNIMRNTLEYKEELQQGQNTLLNFYMDENKKLSISIKNTI
ncbi:MAG: polysaccharide pyruvyl transferase family protein [Deltaproteobacteria bacterium]|nr:polysaccharide pyruvyl transferase family protein [Deltaproteobacteria bacterium]